MTDRLSIASVCRDLPGPENSSGGIFVLRRLAAMAKKADVTAVQPVPWFPMVAPLPRWARQPERTTSGVRIQPTPMFYFPKYLKSLDGFWLHRAIARKLLALKQHEHLDAIDAHFGFPEGVGALRAARELGVPCFVTLRGFEAEYIEKPVIGDQIRHLLESADGIICVSHFLKDLAFANGATQDRTTVIHNAIDQTLFYPGDQNKSRQALGLPMDAPIVITVGHLISRKRHHVLIAAFAEVLRRIPTARLLVIGGESFEPRYPKDLVEQVARSGIKNSVAFLGNVDAGRVGDYLRAADVFALGTQREGCCNAVLEALACGLPVITTPVGDNTWFVNDGQNGAIVPVDDNGALARAVVEALEFPDWDRRHIAASLGVGDWDRVAGEVLSFIREQMEKPLKSASSMGLLDQSGA